MGRQVAIVATQGDIEEFLSFLRETTEIAIFKAFAESIKELWIDRPLLPEDWTFYIWNKRFAWNPEYKRVGEQAYHPEKIGWYYVSNTNIAPIIEVDCGDVSNAQAGRIYWSKFFVAPHGLDYDVTSFTKWYDSMLGGYGRTVENLHLKRWHPIICPLPGSESKSMSGQQ